MPSDVPRSPGRVPVAIYLASPGGDPGGVLENHCRTFAESREWVVAAVFTDAAPLPALEARPGWCSVQDALAAGTARGVVTWTRSMVADDAGKWERLAVLIGELGWFLVAGALDTPGQSLYGRGATEQLSVGRRPEPRRALDGDLLHPGPPPGLSGP